MSRWLFTQHRFIFLADSSHSLIGLAWDLHLFGKSQPMGVYMTKTQLLKRIAYLESVNDQLSTEVTYVDHLMRLIGFSDGLITVKATAQEIIDNGLDISQAQEEE